MRDAVRTLEDGVRHAQVRRQREIGLEIELLPGVRQVVELASLDRFLDLLLRDLFEAHASIVTSR